MKVKPVNTAITTFRNTVRARCQKARQRMNAFAGRCLSDAGGMVAVEFALLIPVMLTLYFGTIETTNAM